MWTGGIGSGDLITDGKMGPGSGQNLILGNMENVGSGQQVFAMRNVVTVPVSLGFEGGILYVQSGHLNYIGQLGTVTTVASA